MIFKKDNFIFGLALGLIGPVFGFILYKFIKYRSFTLEEMFQWLKLNPNLITVFISVSLFANAVLFTIYINGHRDKTAKGIFLMTILYAIIAMIFKYS
jgi:hypothetical protein